MKQELITEEEVTSQLRKQGIEDVGGVKLAFIEPDGHISIIKEEPASAPDAKSPKP